MNQVQSKKFYNTGINVLQDNDISTLLAFLKSRSKRKRKKERTNHAAQISLALFSGLRLSEVSGLRWSDIRQGFSFKKWFVCWNAKKRNRMPALLNIISEEILDEIFQRKSKSDFVFLSSSRSGHVSNTAVHASWKRIQLQLWNFTSYSFHDLRHTAITNFYRFSRDINQTAQFARHKNFTTTQRYIHLVEREKCEIALSSITNQFKSIVGYIANVAI